MNDNAKALHAGISTKIYNNAIEEEDRDGGESPMDEEDDYLLVQQPKVPTVEKSLNGH